MTETEITPDPTLAAQPIWAIMPVLSRPDLTLTAISDVLAQTLPTRLLILNQGVEDGFRQQLEAVAAAQPDRVLIWSHQPPLPSLAASWNRALDFVWEAGGREAWVVNNDIRVHRETLRYLHGTLRETYAYFVTPVGVTPEQFDPHAEIADAFLAADADGWKRPISPGGPDFSCFLISRDAHAQYRFDESFVPAFCEDLDTHRRMLLAGDGHRIFSINLPYLHYGSQTLKSAEPARRAAIEAAISKGSRVHYLKKWGGPVNQERFTIAFESASAQDGVTTPELQHG